MSESIFDTCLSQVGEAANVTELLQCVAESSQAVRFFFQLNPTEDSYRRFISVGPLITQATR